jgi:hypothetical protein
MGNASDSRDRVCRPEVICLNNYPMHEEAVGIQEAACAFAAGGAKRMPKSVPYGRVPSVPGSRLLMGDWREHADAEACELEDGEKDEKRRVQAIPMTRVMAIPIREKRPEMM